MKTKNIPVKPVVSAAEPKASKNASVIFVRSTYDFFGKFRAAGEKVEYPQWYADELKRTKIAK
jgi:hypothetical protein